VGSELDLDLGEEIGEAFLGDLPAEPTGDDRSETPEILLSDERGEGSLGLPESPLPKDEPTLPKLNWPFMPKAATELAVEVRSEGTKGAVFGERVENAGAVASARGAADADPAVGGDGVLGVSLIGVFCGVKGEPKGEGMSKREIVLLSCCS